MIINHNLGAMNALRNMNINSANASKSMQKLSSGLRINSAADDAAGLAISEKMRGQIRGLDQASANAQDGISLVQTAEGALNETTSILQRMRELAVQGSSDTLNSSDRGQIQKEMDQLTSEIDRIGNTTEFNTKKLLNGGAGIQATQTTGTGATVVGGASGVNAGGDLVLTGVAAAKAASITFDATTAMGVGTDTDFAINGVTIKLTAGMTGSDIATAVNNVSGQTGVSASYNATTFALTMSTAGVGSSAQLNITDLTLHAAGNAADTFTGGAMAMTDQNSVNLITSDLTDASITEVAGNDATVAVDNTTTGVDPTFSAKGNVVTFHGGDFDGLEVDVKNASAASTLHIDENNTLTMQIGANESQTMNISVNDMRASALGVSNIDVSNATNAGKAITTVQAAIDAVSTERAKLGAYSNRLDHTIANLGTSSENMTSAESRIRDVDMAKEMSTFSKNNILSQAAQAMLAQSNSMPQQVLQLLK